MNYFASKTMDLHFSRDENGAVLLLTYMTLHLLRRWPSLDGA